jgi:hypothetical protein
MGEIEKRHNLKISISEKYIFLVSRNLILLWSKSLFWMEKFEINKPIRYGTFPQGSIFEMSHFAIVKAK